MRVAFVVQRCGIEVNGGAELLCRQVAERMARHWDVEILTTCAIDYMTWKDHYPPGLTEVNGVPVRRFPVERPRNVRLFNRLCARVFHQPHTAEDEQAWMRAQGPDAPDLLRHLADHAEAYDFFIFFTYLYATTVFGLPLVRDRAALVPTAHDEPPIYLGIYHELFQQTRVLVFNTPWEQQFVNTRFGTTETIQDVIGCGIDLPPQIEPDRFRTAHAGALENADTLLYVGRIDRSKGCDTLASHFMRFRVDAYRHPTKLVLLGERVWQPPPHPDIVPLGFVSDQEKFDALADATIVVAPSPYESLSIVALEAWRLARPVLVNGRCEVLRDQCLRSNGGLWYTSYGEFREGLSMMLREPALRGALGADGRRFVDQNYSWPVIEDRYCRLIASAASPRLQRAGGYGA
jgi:glycosyltransferase involved in cell wall biosynthesis